MLEGRLALRRLALRRLGGISRRADACRCTLFRVSRIRLVGLVAVGLALLVAGGSDAALRSFTARFSQNLKGNFVFVGNTLMTCPGAVAACPGARDATGATINDNDFTMTYVDVDSDAVTFDSSSADLSLAAGSTVEFAGLYWGADTSAGTNGMAAPDATQLGKVLITPPGGTQTTVTASQLDTSGTRYQGFADVTSTVDSAGNGAYTVANVQAGTGQDRYAGWSLVVVYSNVAETTRNVTVFDGFQIVNGGTPTITIPVSGFLTPPSGPVNTSLGVIAYEGDRGLLGDSLQLGPNVGSLTTMTDAQNPTTNFFNSTISHLGTLVTGKSPDYVNQLGFDADVVDASGVLPNSSISAVMRLTTGGETYFPGVVVFATQLFAPDLLTTIAKSATDLNGARFSRATRSSTRSRSRTPARIARRTLCSTIRFRRTRRTCRAAFRSRLGRTPARRPTRRVTTRRSSTRGRARSSSASAPALTRRAAASSRPRSRRPSVSASPWMPEHRTARASRTRPRSTTTRSHSAPRTAE